MRSRGLDGAHRDPLADELLIRRETGPRGWSRGSSTNTRSGFAKRRGDLRVDAVPAA